MKRGIFLISVLAAIFAARTAAAQVPTTTVSDTVYYANGTPAQGTIVLSWNAFTTANGSAIAAGTTSVTLGTGGALTIALAPNAGATPMGNFYTAVYHLDDGETSREFWVIPVAVPGGGPAKLAGIRNQVLPTTVAMQTVSKQYVDAEIAAALSGPASGDLSGSYPGPTVSAVHATGGTLDNTVIGGSTPAAATFTTAIATSGTFGQTASAGIPLWVHAATNENARFTNESGIATLSGVNDLANAFVPLKIDGNALHLNSQSGANVEVGGSPSATPGAGLTVANGDTYISATASGLILTDSAGACWRVTPAATTGTLSAAPVSCPAH